MSNLLIRYPKNVIDKGKCSSSFAKYIICITIICALGMLADLKALLGQRSVMMLEDQEFANNGLSAHMGNYISIAIIFFIGCLYFKNWKVNKIFSLFMLALCLFLIFLTAIKGQLLLPIIGGIIFLLYYNKIHISLKAIIILSSISACLFVGMGIVFNSDKESVGLDFMIDFFAYYLFSGLTGLSGFLAKDHIIFGEYPLWIGRFFINFYEKFFGSGELYLDTGIKWVRVTCPDAFIQHDSNVYTLIGEIFVNCGFLFGTVVIFILGWYTSFLFEKARNNYVYGLIYAYVGACIFFNFFSTYIIQPGFYESQFFCFIVVILSRYKYCIGKKQYR